MDTLNSTLQFDNYDPTRPASTEIKPPFPYIEFNWHNGFAAAELRQLVVYTNPTRHITKEWAKRHLNVETNGFEAELNTAFGKGNWTLT